VLTDGSFTYPINAFYTNHANNARNNEFFRIHSGETGATATALRVTTGGTIAAPTQNALVVMASSGNVGVGTTPNPAYKLDVAGSLNIAGNATFTGQVSGGNIVAKYQDVAEWVPADDELQPGTVVVVQPDASNHVVASAHAYDTGVAGVVSTQPGITLGEPAAGKAKVATTGRVKVRVDASHSPIRAGDVLVTSDIPGTAMRSTPIDVAGIKLHRPGTIIGKALEPLPNGKGEILVLLSLQ